MVAALAEQPSATDRRADAADQAATRVYPIPQAQSSSEPETKIHPRPQLPPPAEDEPRVYPIPPPQPPADTSAQPTVTRLPVWRRHPRRLAAVAAAAAAVIIAAVVALSLGGRTSTQLNNVKLGRFGRNRSNVWPYAGVTTFGKERNAELGMHPTVKPVALIADAIMDCSRRGAIVLDAFAGSGTTLIAAERIGGKTCIEVEPQHVDSILRRFGSLYGLKPVHTPSNKSLEEIETERLRKARYG